ncbi:MAG: ABC transporter permease [Pseudomonadota bacterium]
MFFYDLLRVSLRQIVRQRLRNAGVVLSIALGTAGLITIITMGGEVKNNLNQDLELLGGATRIKAYFETQPENEIISRPQWFRQHTVEALRRLSGVTGVSLLVLTRQGTVSTLRDRIKSLNVVGVDEYFWSVNSFSPKRGRFFGAEEVAQRQRVCVLGEDLVKDLFKDQESVGRYLSLNDDLYQVIGVLGGLGVGDRTNWVFLPFTTAQDRIQGMRPPEIVYLRCRNWDDVEPVAAAIPLVVKANQPDDGLKVDVSWERLEKVKSTSWWIEMFVYLAIAATLGLGGFGIWNTMMVAVRARTREIGLKKAMGAEDRDILAQFLTESLCLSLGSALLGVVLGRAGVEIVAGMLHIRPPEQLFFNCVIMGLAFALILGLTAGLSPSIKASRMEVVSAVKYE